MRSLHRDLRRVHLVPLDLVDDAEFDEPVPADTVPRSIVRRILRLRPFHPWHLIPLAAYLCEQGYSDPARNAIIDSVGDGMMLESLVVDGSLERTDLSSARAALSAGREQRARHNASCEAVTPDDEDWGAYAEVPARAWTIREKRAFQTEIEQHYREHPEA